jgi:hypothetical protein
MHQRQAPRRRNTRRHAPTSAIDTETNMSSAIGECSGTSTTVSRRVTSLAMRMPSPSTCSYNDTDAAGGLQYYSSRGSIDHVYVPASATHTAAATTR